MKVKGAGFPSSVFTTGRTVLGQEVASIRGYQALARIPAPSKSFLLCNKSLREVGVTKRLGKGNYIKRGC